MKKYDTETEQQMRDLFERLNERDKRHYAATEASKVGYGGQRYIASVLGCSTKTIQRGQTELSSENEPIPAGRSRRVGGGRKPFDKKRSFNSGVSQCD